MTRSNSAQVYRVSVVLRVGRIVIGWPLSAETNPWKKAFSFFTKYHMSVVALKGPVLIKFNVPHLISMAEHH